MSTPADDGADQADDARHAVAAKHRRGTLATIKRDGRPQLSVVSYHYDPGTRLVRVSTRSSLAKTANLRRDPRASLVVITEDMSYVVLEGTTTISAVAADPHDDVVEALVTLYREITGEHPDWDEYRTAMVDEGRVILSIEVERAYGYAR